jgi:hypothetical protein
MKLSILFITAVLVHTNSFTQIHISSCNQKMLTAHRKVHKNWNSSEQDSLCIIGLDSARKDIRKRIIKHYNIGFSPARTDVIYNYLKNIYNIEFEKADCDAASDLFCYNRVMDSVLNATYGKDFWDKAYYKVDSVQQLGLIDRDVMYKGGKKAQNKEFYKLLKKQGVHVKTMQVYATILIDSIGSVKEVTDIYCEQNIEEHTIKKAIFEMKHWLPAIEFGKKITETGILSFVMINNKIH